MRVLSWWMAAAFVVLEVGGASSRAAGTDHNRYNVLFIAVDDLRPALGCYGVQAAHSPHLDRLAARSVLFTRHYVQVPTCGASRYALLTGRSPARSGVTRRNDAFYRGPAALDRHQQAGAQTMPELFRRSGYETVLIGKISHTPDGLVYAYDGSGEGREEVPHAWDRMVTPMGEWQRGWGIFFAYANGRHREDGQGNRDLMEFIVERDEDLPDGLMARRAVAELKRLKREDKRFFLGLGFFKPHLPWVAPRQDWEALEEATIELPDSAEKRDSPYWHRSGEFYQYDMPFAKERPLTPEAQRRSRRAYLACVRYVDRQVGKVLQALDDLDLERETIVVIWGDHGWHLGEQQIWGKHTPWERALRSVLMLRVPGLSKNGLRTGALVETLDLYPTLLDLCAPEFTRIQHELDGRSLRPILAGEQSGLREEARSYWGAAVSVRTAAHRRIWTNQDGERIRRETWELGP